MKELEDYSWFPNFLRVQQMEYIGWLVVFLDTYKTLAPIADSLLSTLDDRKITDLCSGSGQPANYLASVTHVSALTTTDLYPQDEAIALDVMHLDDYSLQGLVTLFNAFHHFDEGEQASILDAIARQGNPAMIVEILQPTILQYLQILVGTTIGQILTAPLVRPFRWSRILLTYILPINLFTVTYDGLVSVYKSKKLSSYQALASATSTRDYHWSATTINSTYWTTLTLLKGEPQ